MTEQCKHEWILCVGNEMEEAWFRCGVLDCKERLEVDEALSRLNEYETLKAATPIEAYSLIQPCVQQLQDSLRKGDLVLNDYLTSMVEQIAKGTELLADILEGKDE